MSSLSMKVCSWCERPRSMSEEGAEEIIEEGKTVRWICDHCLFVFDNNCDCVMCNNDYARI